MGDNTDFYLNFPGPVQFIRPGQPLYIQLADIFRQQIELGKLPAGARLPNLLQMAAHFDVARVTVRQAVQMLVAEGYLTSRQGRGVHVASSLPRKIFQSMHTSWQNLVKRIEGASVELLEAYDTTSCPLLAPWQLEPVPVYRYMRRVHIKDNIRFAYIDLYLDKDIFDRAPDRFNATTVIPVMDELKINIVRARQQLTIGTASPDASLHLRIPCGSPVAHVQRYACDKSGRAVYAAIMMHPGDKVLFDIELVR